MAEQIILKPEVIGYLQQFPVTNTLFVSWLTVLILISLSYLATRKLQLVPSGLQNVLELVIETGYSQVSELAQSRTKVFFPIVMTFFLYILLSNWLGLLPGFNTIGFFHQTNGRVEFTPLLRSINSDLNMTLALALTSAVLTHAFAIKYLGLKNYLQRWVSLNPIFLFVGLLEIVSELTKIISLSFRLFGNIFAGEAALATVSSQIFAFLVPLPLYLLELVVGFVQAVVFMMLTLVFMVLLTEKHENY